jgi:flagellar basal-body rod protein FlgF
LPGRYGLARGLRCSGRDHSTDIAAMESIANIAASRLVAQQRALDVVANNIANASTPGYKAERVLFSDWLSRQSDTSASPGGGAIAYTQDRATWRDFSAGPLTHTSNPFDLALTSDGYFTVSTPRGPRLTRDGRFGPMPDGTIADGAGNTLLDTNGKPIQLAPTDTSIEIASDGTVSSENGELGKIGIVRPADPMKLQAEGATTFLSSGPTTAVAAPGLVQGAVEESNVQPIQEVARMMNDLRQFQFVSELVESEGQRQQSAIDKLTQPHN